MMSLEQLRQSLNRPDLTDRQAEQIRDALDCLARAFVAEHVRQRKAAPPPQER